MMTHTTLEQLKELKLQGMADALQEQLLQSTISSMSFEERLALLVDREVNWRNDRKLVRLLKMLTCATRRLRLRIWTPELAGALIAKRS